MATYYVSPTGSDNNAGSLGSPFGSLQHAHDLARPGDTILMRGGVYHLSQGIQFTNDGASGNPITVANYPGEHPVLDASAMTSADYYSTSGAGGWILSLASSSWNHISGLELRGGPMGGLVLWGASNNNVIERLDVHHNGRLSEWEGKGITVYGSSANNHLLNNDSHHNQDLNLSNGDGFQISTSGAGNVLRGNRAYANSDDGFDFFTITSNTRAASVVLDGNWAFGNGFDLNGNPAGDGNGFKLGGHRSGSTSGGHILTNNVSWDNRAIGFDQNDANTAITLFNNTAYDNGLYNYSFWSGQNIFVNNIAVGDGRVSAVGSAHHNSWNLPSPATLADFLSLNDALARGARGVDGSLPLSDFLRLAANSHLVDAGSDVGLVYAGGAPDLGSYEHGVVTLPPLPSDPTTPVQPVVTLPPPEPSDPIPPVVTLPPSTEPVGFGGSTPPSTTPTDPISPTDPITPTQPVVTLPPPTEPIGFGGSSPPSTPPSTSPPPADPADTLPGPTLEIVTGTPGRDVLSGFGHYALAGGSGNDDYRVDSTDQVAEAAGAGFDRVFTSETYSLTPGSEIEQLLTLNPRGVDAVSLTGNEFAQTIVGNRGSNVINGREGSDVLEGGRGADTFVFDAPIESGVDRLPDFSLRQHDTIRLDRIVFTELQTGPLPASAFHVGAAATSPNEHVLYNPSSGALFYDADGAGGAAAVQFAALPDRLNLTQQDFYVNWS